MTHLASELNPPPPLTSLLSYNRAICCPHQDDSFCKFVYVIERSEPRWIRVYINICWSNNMIFWVEVVSNRTVLCDWHFDFLCRSHRLVHHIWYIIYSGPFYIYIFFKVVSFLWVPQREFTWVGWLNLLLLLFCYLENINIKLTTIMYHIWRRMTPAQVSIRRRQNVSHTKFVYLIYYPFWLLILLIILNVWLSSWHISGRLWKQSKAQVIQTRWFTCWAKLAHKYLCLKTVHSMQ